MKRAIALRLLKAVKDQRGPLPHVHTTATGRHCVIGLLNAIAEADGVDPMWVSPYDLDNWAGTTSNERKWLIRLNDSSPKREVVARLMEMAK